MNLLLVDTDILIDVGRAERKAVERLKNEESKFSLAVSSVTQMELIIGCRNKTELKLLDKFLNKFEIISISEEISSKSIELLKKYRLSHGLLIADCLIASTAIIFDISLLSKNQKDYKFIENLKLQNY